MLIVAELQVKSKQRVSDFAEVYTAKREVENMCNLIPQEQWDNIDTTFLEPACGNGNFLVEILDRKFKLCNTYQDGLRALRSITGIDIQADNCEETRQRLFNMYCDRFSDCREEAKSILDKQIICGDSIKIQEQWYKEELMRDIGSLAQALLDKVVVKPKPDKDGKIVSVIEWHDDCSIADYLKSALEVHKGMEMLDGKLWDVMANIAAEQRRNQLQE